MNYEEGDRRNALAIRAQNGDKDALFELWERVEGYCNKIVRRYRYAGERGYTTEDLLQEAYFGFLDAVRRFNPEKNKSFNVMLEFCIRGHIHSNVFRTYRKDLPKTSLSLNATLGDRNGSKAKEYESFFFDETVDAEFENVERLLYITQLRATLGPILQELTPKQLEAVHLLYWDNLTYEEAAKKAGLAKMSVWYRVDRALEKLRRHKAELAPFMYS